MTGLIISPPLNLPTMFVTILPSIPPLSVPSWAINRLRSPSPLLPRPPRPSLIVFLNFPNSTLTSPQPFLSHTKNGPLMSPLINMPLAIRSGSRAKTSASINTLPLSSVPAVTAPSLSLPLSPLLPTNLIFLRSGAFSTPSMPPSYPPIATLLHTVRTLPDPSPTLWTVKSITKLILSLTLASSATPRPFNILSIGRVTPLPMTSGSPPPNYLRLLTLFPLIICSTHLLWPPLNPRLPPTPLLLRTPCPILNVVVDL